MARRLLLAVLLAGVLLATGGAPPAAAAVMGVTVTTDRTDYVAGMSVTATAAITIDPPYNQADEAVVVEWLNASWIVLRSEIAPKVQVNQRDWQATASWWPPLPGDYHVNVTSNTTNGTPPPVSGTASFTVWSANDYVIARGVRVATDRLAYERGQLATATANFTANPLWILGNVSRLEVVQFNWFDPSGVPVRPFVNVSVSNGEASDSWTPTAVGANYTVTATYLGNDSVSNTTAYHVMPVTTPATNVTAGQTTWDAARSPWRVCGDLDVAPSAALTIEANVTVKFCRGSRLIVRGTLTADGSAAAPITLTSYEFLAAAGDWGGVRFEAGPPSRVVGAVVEYAADGIVAVDASPTLVGLTLRAGSGEAVNLTRSSAILRDSSISGFARGLRLWDATPEVENVTIGGSSREGVHVTGSTGAVLRAVRVSGGNYSLRAEAAPALTIERSALSGASFWAASLTGSSATFVNSSIGSSAGGQDFLLVAATATLVNSSFTDVPAKRTIVGASRLVVQNFLTVVVRGDGGAPLGGAEVSVTVNGRPLLERTTDVQGTAAWILLEDRRYNATSMSKNAIELSVSAVGYAVDGNPRTVNMTSSHTETFAARSLSLLSGPGGLLILLAILGSASLLTVFLIGRRRRRRRPSGAGPTEPTPGTSYAFLDERPDLAFSEFARRITEGAPGLCVTRIHPKDARARIGNDGVPIYWLSRSFAKETLTLNPTNLGAIVQLVKKTAANPGTFVLLDGLEYLFTQNDLVKVVKFVQALADVVAERKAILFVPINPDSLDPDRLAVLTRDLQKWT